MKLRSYRVKSFIMKSGERSCLLVDKVTGLPLYYPNLYVTTQVRNKSLSVASMESALTSINVLLTFCNERDIDLEARFLRREFFQLNEFDAIRDHCQLKFIQARSDPAGNVVSMSSKGRKKDQPKIGTVAEYVRLTHIAEYSKWLAEVLLSTSMDRDSTRDIEKMLRGLKSRRPERKGRNQVGELKGLTHEQVDVLLEVIRPGSEKNPFVGIDIQVRNQLIILLLKYLGIRGGELLNISTNDIKWTEHHIVIARRADERSDPRVDQPLVKTLDRRLPVKDTLIKLLHDYVNKYRKKVPGARLHDFLLVTHKSGPTQGQPLSRSSYIALINQIANASPELASLHGHGLRHTWNNEFSEYMDQMLNPPSPEEQEIRRSELQGWKKGSITATVYTKRFNAAKAMEAGLQLQEGMSRLPENLKND